MPYLDYAIQHNSSNLNFLPVKYAGEIIQLKKEISKTPRILHISLIATSYMEWCNKEGCIEIHRKILES